MIEKRRMCLACGDALQQAGIPCELVGAGVHGICPHCKKKRLCYNWKVERREKTPIGLRPLPPEGEARNEEGD